MSAERVGPVCFLLISIAFLTATLCMPIGVPRSPGPGFMPLLLGGLMVLLSAGFTYNAFRRPVPRTALAPPSQGRQVIWMILGLAAYWGLFTTLGFPLLTLSFLVLFMRLLGTTRWWLVVLVALAVTGASILIFEVWLSIPFPKGLWWPE